MAGILSARSPFQHLNEEYWTFKWRVYYLQGHLPANTPQITINDWYIDKQYIIRIRNSSGPCSTSSWWCCGWYHCRQRPPRRSSFLVWQVSFTGPEGWCQGTARMFGWRGGATRPQCWTLACLTWVMFNFSSVSPSLLSDSLRKLVTD